MRGGIDEVRLRYGFFSQYNSEEAEMIVTVRNIALLLMLLPGTLLAQKIGILSFEDASGTGPQLGEQVAKFIRSDMLKEKRFIPKFIMYTPGQDESPSVDVEKAVEIGKKQGVEYVVIGTILEAESNTSKTGLGGIHLLGQSVGSSVNTVSATITIQADLISVKDGKLMESFRTSGSDTNAAVGADVSTHWGRFDADRDGTSDSPIAKALREAVEDLVKQLSEKI
jgi:hypothetical protein